MLARAVLGMQDSVSVDVLYYRRDPNRGWQFKPDEPGCTSDTAAGGITFIRELYERGGSKEKSVRCLAVQEWMYDLQCTRNAFTVGHCCFAF